jgi:putative methanogenesis marker protein 8
MIQIDMGKHLIETCGARVLIYNDRVKVLSEPKIRYCPVYNNLYGYKRIDREKVKEIIQGQIQDHLFTKRRVFSDGFLITFGASEMLSMALESKLIDCCVIVCEGAGTVIVNDPKLVQGIGARLTGILRTSPIAEIMNELKEKGTVTISDKAHINQLKGVKEAIKLGYKRIAVTIAGFESDKIPKLRQIENKERIALNILSVHNPSLKDSQVPFLLLSDLVWSCSSSVVREKVGPKALMQIGSSIPVFALTERGKEIALNYLMKTDLPILVTRAELPKLSPENSPYPLT